ncbi:DUF4410 domain-containing protein [Lysobacter sp. P5_B9]
MNFRPVLFLLIAGFLSGCMGTTGQVYVPNKAVGSRYWYEIVNSAEMSEAGVQELRKELDIELRSRNLLAVETDPEARKVKITITNYYMRAAAARFLVGIMAGRDNIHSVVTITDVKSGEELGRIEVDSHNPTAMGTAGGLIESHATEIADFMSGVRG